MLPSSPFKQLVSLFALCATLCTTSLYPLPLAKLRGCNFTTEKIGCSLSEYALSGMIGYLAKKGVVENLLRHGVKNHPMVKVAYDMFHQVSLQDPIQETKNGFYGKATFQKLGQFGALALKKEIRTEVRVIKRHGFKPEFNSSIAAPIITTITLNSSFSARKIAELLGHFLDAMDGAGAYNKALPLVLLNALVITRAKTKTDYLDFINGFYESCSENEKLWFTSNHTFNIKNWENLVYTKDDYNAICAQSFKNPSIWDLLYICAQKNNPINWMNISFSLPSEKAECVGDCCEAGIWAILQLVLSPLLDAEYDLSLIPKDLQNKKSIKEFVKLLTGEDINDKLIRKSLFFMLSDPQFKTGRGKIVYNQPALCYELKPSISNILNALNYLFESDVQDFKTLGTLLSSEKQTITFEIKEDAPQSDCGTIDLTITDNNTKATRCLTLDVSSKHVNITQSNQKKSASEINHEELLNSLNCKKTDFPFSTCFYNPTPAFNLFRPFSRNELNNVFRLWKTSDNESVLLQQRVLKLIDFSTIIYQEGDLDNDVVQILAQSANKSPFKEFIAHANSTELIRMLIQNNSLETFISNIDKSWSGFKELSSLALIANNYLVTKGTLKALTFLETYKSDWKTDEKFIDSLWKTFFTNPQNNNIIEDPKLDFFEPLFKYTLLPSSALITTLWYTTSNLDLLNKLLDHKYPDWRKTKKIDDNLPLWAGLSKNSPFLKAIGQNTDSILFQALTKDVDFGINTLTNIWLCTEDPATFVAYLNATNKGWETDSEYIKILWEILKDCGKFPAYIGHPAFKRFVKTIDQNDIWLNAIIHSINQEERDLALKSLNSIDPKWGEEKEFVQKIWQLVLPYVFLFDNIFGEAASDKLYEPFHKHIDLLDRLHILWKTCLNPTNGAINMQQLLNQEQPNWHTNDLFVQTLWKNLAGKKNHFIDALKDFPPLEVFRPFIQQILLGKIFLSEDSPLKKEMEKWLMGFLSQENILFFIFLEQHTETVLNFLENQKINLTKFINKMKKCSFKTMAQNYLAKY